MTRNIIITHHYEGMFPIKTTIKAPEEIAKGLFESLSAICGHAVTEVTLELTGAELRAQWKEEVAADRTLLSFDEWVKR